MPNIKFIPIGIVEIIIVFAIVLIWGKKFANPRLVIISLGLGLLLLDIIIVFVLK